MPIKVQGDLPAKEILERENIFVMDANRAMHQDIRPIQILIVNLMPLKEETELQLLRSLSNTPLQIDVTFLTMNSHESKNTSTSHLNKFYLHFQDIYDLSEYLENDALLSLIGDIPNPEYMLTNPAEASRQLCNAFINQGHLFSILFPDDNRSYGVLTNKLDALIKEKIYDVRPEFRDDLAKNVEVSMFVQGCAYTFLKYKDQDAAMVIDTLAGIIDRATRA